MELSDFFIDNNGELAYTDNIFNGYYLDNEKNIRCNIANTEIDWIFSEVCFYYETRGFGINLFLKHGAYNFILSCRNYDIECLKRYNSENKFTFKILVIPGEEIKNNPDLLEDVNKVVNCTEYFEIFLKKYKGFKIV